MKFLKGKICIMDPKNMMRQKEGIDIVFVYVRKRVRLFNIFPTKLWECILIENSWKNTIIHEKYLYSALELSENLDGVVIRNPINTPEISSDEIDALKISLEIISRIKQNSDDFIDLGLNLDSIKLQLRKIISKLSFYNMMMIEKDEEWYEE